MPHLLVLGGTGEAAALAARLAGCDLAVTLSLAGRTRAPRVAPVPMRVGGFGGPEGLAAYLAAARVDAVIDATHPFAARMCWNASAACRAAGVPLLALGRPPWPRVPGDDWAEVDDLAGAVRALGTAPRWVFLTIGRQEVGAFAAAPQHRYLARAIEPLGDALPGARAILARGPFAEAEEAALMRAEGIEVLVTKNAGGPATYAKVAAARALGLPVVMVRRPSKPVGPRVESVEAALAWLAELPGFAHAGTLRGV